MITTIITIVVISVPVLAKTSSLTSCHLLTLLGWVYQCIWCMSSFYFILFQVKDAVKQVERVLNTADTA